MAGEIRNSKLQGMGWVSTAGDRRQTVIPDGDQKQNDPKIQVVKKKKKGTVCLNHLSTYRIKAILSERL